METRLTVPIQPQPDSFTCGPTCLHAIYRYFGDDISHERVIHEVPELEERGTLDVLLAIHALRRGYTAKIFTYNVRIFDPTWFAEPRMQTSELADRLRLQMEAKESKKLTVATEAYLEFLRLGGQLRFEDLTPALIRKYLNRSIPVLTGLSATYLHRSIREFGIDLQDDDIRGEPSGHFVVLCGYDKDTRQVLVADPLESNPVSGSNQYLISIDRVICSVLLGIITYDANLLIIEPARHPKQGRHADSHSRQ